MAKDENKTGEKLFTAEDMKQVAQTIAQEMAVAMMASQQARAPQAPAVSRGATGPKCECCKQPVVACGGVPAIEGQVTDQKRFAAYAKNHTKMVVFPQKYTEFGEWFRGVGINGVWYLSNGPTHAVWVPKLSEGDIAKQVQDYETNERDTRMGRIKQHNSGDAFAPRPVNPSTDGFR